jgi:hypothetical protein
VATPNKSSKQTKNHQQTSCGWRATEWRLRWGRYCFWQYWTKLCVFDVFKFLHFCLILFCFIYAFYRIVSCIICLYFLKHTQASRLGGELAICHMTIGHHLISECLLGNGGYTCLNHFSQHPYTVFTKIVTGQIWDPFETR